MGKFLAVLLSYCICIYGYEYEWTGDGDGVNELCINLLESDESFQNFRLSRFCTQIVDTCWASLGEDFLSCIASDHPSLLSYLEEFRKNDLVGNPGIVFYPRYGSFCPTTLRYALVAGHLQRHFGSLNGKKIVEIGGGYGGLCRILHALYSIQEYIIVDVPAVVELTRKYLAAFNITNVKFITPDQLTTEIVSDLLISNYAFSERSEKSKMHYITKLLNHSKSGYMICNDFGTGRDLFFPEHFHNVNEGVKIENFPEIPQTGGGACYIIVWK
jgi:putative sugar O-methyltransferase